MLCLKQVIYSTDLLSVGGFKRRCCCHSQEFNWCGRITENIRHLLGHCFLHLRLQILERKRWYDDLFMCTMKNMSFTWSGIGKKYCVVKIFSSRGQHLLTYYIEQKAPVLCVPADLTSALPIWEDLNIWLCFTHTCCVRKTAGSFNRKGGHDALL